MLRGAGIAQSQATRERGSHSLGAAMTDSHLHSPSPRLRSGEYTAATWGVSMSTLYRMVRDGRTHPHRVGKHLRFSDAEIERVLRAAEAAPPPAPMSIRRGTVPFA